MSYQLNLDDVVDEIMSKAQHDDFDVSVTSGENTLLIKHRDISARLVIQKTISGQGAGFGLFVPPTSQFKFIYKIVQTGSDGAQILHLRSVRFHDTLKFVVKNMYAELKYIASVVK